LDRKRQLFNDHALGWSRVGFNRASRKRIGQVATGCNSLFEAVIASYGKIPHSGIVVMTDSFTSSHREVIVRSAAQHRVPVVYPYRFFAQDGGLLAYGNNRVEPFRGAAGYVNRILHGERPGDLPVQAPTQFELVINLKTAKALGLTIPPQLVARADEVIE